MEPVKTACSPLSAPGSSPQGQSNVKLRLYIARSTPNSVRAEHNLSVALDRLQGRASAVLEIVDVFLEPKRAFKDSVVVTPTLIGSAGDRRIMLMGDLSDQVHLETVLQDLFVASAKG